MGLISQTALGLKDIFFLSSQFHSPSGLPVGLFKFSHNYIFTLHFPVI